MNKETFEKAQELKAQIDAKQIVLGLFRDSLKFSDIDLRANGSQLLRISPELVREPVACPIMNGQEYERQLKESNAEVFEKIRAVIIWKAKSLEDEIQALERKFLTL